METQNQIAKKPFTIIYLNEERLPEVLFSRGYLLHSYERHLSSLKDQVSFLFSQYGINKEQEGKVADLIPKIYFKNRGQNHQVLCSSKELGNIVTELKNSEAMPEANQNVN